MGLPTPEATVKKFIRNILLDSEPSAAQLACIHRTTTNTMGPSIQKYDNIQTWWGRWTRLQSLIGMLFTCPFLRQWTWSRFESVRFTITKIIASAFASYVMTDVMSNIGVRMFLWTYPRTVILVTRLQNCTSMSASYFPPKSACVN
jgi:hypothetical protein